jgi:hypothetical protein
MTAPPKGFPRTPTAPRSSPQTPTLSRNALTTEMGIELLISSNRPCKSNPSNPGRRKSTTAHSGRFLGARVEKRFGGFLCNALLSGRCKEPAEGTLNGSRIPNDRDCSDILSRSDPVPGARDSKGAFPRNAASFSVTIEPLGTGRIRPEQQRTATKASWCHDHPSPRVYSS